MTQLSINVNKLALIRNSREGVYPSVTEFSQHCVDHGADGITAHPRPDQRHITAQDCIDLTASLSVEFNIEGNPFADAQKSSRPDISDYPGFMALVEQLKPAQCTLVPDNNSQLTSDHGFDLHKDAERLAPIIARLKSLGIRSSLFMDANPSAMQLAADIGADRIELYTGPYAANFKASKKAAVAAYTVTAEAALNAGLAINAGHDLNLHNLGYFIANVPQVAEVSIGHAFAVDCIYQGVNTALAAYKNALVTTNA
jgi:pyridoxine 5-phosphate synthase